MESKKPLILISNDDGYQAKGIRCLIEMVRPLGDLLVCAPDGARSGMACAFSATSPLLLTKRHEEPGLQIWSCNGTPVDCIKMALAELVPRTSHLAPSIILGGINHGDNASVNTHYSGTMGVVMEGCMKYIPSVAYSICDYSQDADFSPMTPYVRSMTERVLNEGLPKGICLNINFPKLEQREEQRDYRGVKVCRMALGTWGNEVSRCRHPRGHDYWWMVGTYNNDEPEAEDTDNWALNHGFVAITPTRMDVTAYEAMEQIRSMMGIDELEMTNV